MGLQRLRKHETLPAHVKWLLRNADDQIKSRLFPMVDAHHKEYLSLRAKNNRLKAKLKDVPEYVHAAKRIKTLLNKHHTIYVFYSKISGKYLCYENIDSWMMYSKRIELVGTYQSDMSEAQFYADAAQLISDLNDASKIQDRLLQYFQNTEGASFNIGQHEEKLLRSWCAENGYSEDRLESEKAKFRSMHPNQFGF